MTATVIASVVGQAAGAMAGNDGEGNRAGAVILVIPTPVALGAIVALGLVAVMVIAARLEAEQRHDVVPPEAKRGGCGCCRRRGVRVAKTESHKATSAEPRGPRGERGQAAPDRGPSGSQRRRTGPGGLGRRGANPWAITAAVAASRPGDVAGSAVTRWEPPGSSVGLHHADGATHVVVMLPLATVLKALALLVAGTVGLAACGGRACAACGKARGLDRRTPAARADQTGKGAKAQKRDKRIMCEAGVQSPVHYTGVGQETGGRYLHECQGFRGAWEVTRVVVDRQKPHQE